MIARDFFQLVLVDHLDGYLFTGEHMPGHLDDGKVAFTERLLQVVHAGDVATIVLSWSDRIRFADHAAAVLHRLHDPLTHPDDGQQTTYLDGRPFRDSDGNDRASCLNPSSSRDRIFWPAHPYYSDGGLLSNLRRLHSSTSTFPVVLIFWLPIDDKMIIRLRE